MSTIEFPGPRDALDTGSVAELCEDCRAIDLPLFEPVPDFHEHVDITVPDDASALVRELDDYGF